MSEEATSQRRVVAYSGKVARLPLAVREQLNQRLFQNDAEADVLEWLNADPTVVQTLAAHFGGVLVAPSHLAAWKRTGYAEWAKRHAAKEQRLAPLKRAMAATETASPSFSSVESLLRSVRFSRRLHVESAEVRPGAFLFLVVNGLPAELLKPDFRLLARGLVVMRGGPPHSMPSLPLPKRLGALLKDATDDSVVVELACRQLHADLSDSPRDVGPVPVPTWEEAMAARWNISPRIGRIEQVSERRRRGGICP